MPNKIAFAERKHFRKAKSTKELQKPARPPGFFTCPTSDCCQGFLFINKIAICTKIYTFERKSLTKRYLTNCKGSKNH